MSIAQNYGNTKPSLLLDFANVKKLDPRVSFSRASGATYYGTQTAKAEENLQTQSQTFIDTTGDNATTTNNAVIAPDGTTTAASVVEDTSTGNHSTSSNAITYEAKEYTFSFFAKPNGRSWVSLRIQGATKAWFDVTNGVVGTTAGGVTASIVASAQGYYRCIATFTISAGLANLFFRLGSADNTDSYTGDGVSGINIWGLQVEARDSATAYTPTTTQPITNYIPVLETASANVARFDHDPVTGESLGLLVEEQRTNLVTYSEDFGNAAWQKFNSTIESNVAVAPDGTLIADVTSSTGSGPFLYRSFSFTSGTTYAFTIYAKAINGTSIGIAGNNAALGLAFASYNLSTGVASPASGTGASASITPVGNGWYRCTLIMVASGTGSYQIRVYTTDNFNSMAIWGAQLEAGAFPTSYIKTEASQVTRSADSASDTTIDDWYRADQGTLYAEGSMIFSNFPRLAMLSDGTFNNKIDLLATNATTMFGAVTVSGSDVLNQSVTATVTNSNKMALAYAVNNGATSVNASTPTTDTSMLVPVVSQLNIGASATANRANGHIRKLAFYPSRLSNENLVAITS